VVGRQNLTDDRENLLLVTTDHQLAKFLHGHHVTAAALVGDVTEVVRLVTLLGQLEIVELGRLGRRDGRGLAAHRFRRHT
ncbi:hypothetical protein PMAYCL1PPCAC_28511, partial [Pristionchus mayeri]